MAASQKNAQQTTNGKLSNSSSEALTLTDKKVWQGSHYADFPEIIEDGDAREFTHESVTDDDDSYGSVAGLVYRRRDGTKWVVAWSNPLDENSKVYTDIQRQPVHWGQIKTDLEKRGKPKYKVTKFGYVASIVIDAASRSPTMKASFGLEA
ncbi:Oxygen regulatory nreC [Gossypium arboreum]|uniref:Oxygen regulatory nreC n=1 Tax=Gossypium arboreum TaxID=29729 RepID=A0A0B0PFY3_GOSAR|nr:Oxygen regulatory nreC [Gossypium arboreum]